MTAPAAVVLAGGASRRMGASKAVIDWHGAPLVSRVALLLGRIAAPVVVVAAAGGDLPDLPPPVEIVRDRRPGAGPLEGIAAGLAALDGRAERAVLCPVDLPFIRPELARRLCELAAGHELAVAELDGRLHPLPACIATSALAQVEALLERGERRVGVLADRLGCRRAGRRQLLADLALAAVDPQLRSLRNVNTPADLAEARAAPLPSVDLIAAGRRERRSAATLGALGLRAAHVRINGAEAPTHPWLPLLDGDVVDASGQESRPPTANWPLWTSGAQPATRSSAGS